MFASLQPPPHPDGRSNNSTAVVLPRHVPATASGPARLDERSRRLRLGYDGSDDSDMASEPSVSGERAVDAANLRAPAPVRTPLRYQPYATTRTALTEPLALTPSPLHNQPSTACAATEPLAHPMPERRLL